MTYYCHTETTRNPNPDNTYTIKVTQYPHEWIYDSGPADTEHHYTCAKCGQTKTETTKPDWQKTDRELIQELQHEIHKLKTKRGN